MRIGEGPSVEFVRQYVSKNVDINNVPKKFIDMILKKYIPDSTGEAYGSWEGFDIFGVNFVIFINVRREIKKYRKAVLVLRKLVPIWLEKAYRIDGCMYKILIKKTMIGK